MSATDFPLDTICAVAFDIDGVLSPLTVPLGPDGVPVRMANLRDGFAMLQAVRNGMSLAIISGAVAPGLEERFRAIGITDIFLGVRDKVECFRKWADGHGFPYERIAYVGDDVPDLGLMRMVGLPVAPSDADAEVRRTARMITKSAGGYGVARELLQMIMLAKNIWPSEALANYNAK